jgi:hypothetical protein
MITREFRRAVELIIRRMIASLPTYANNAAAIAGGLTIGSLYHTGADPDQICIVH